MEERAGRAAAPAVAEIRPPDAGIAQAELDELALRAGRGIDPPLAGEDPAFAHQPGEVPAVGRRVMDLVGTAAAGPQPGLVAHRPARLVGRRVGDGGLDLRHRHRRTGRRRAIGVVDAGGEGLRGAQQEERKAYCGHGIEAGLCRPGCLVSPLSRAKAHFARRNGPNACLLRSRCRREPDQGQEGPGRGLRQPGPCPRHESARLGREGRAHRAQARLGHRSRRPRTRASR